MGNNINKKVKSLISGLITNDEKKIDMLVNDLSESILTEKEEKIMKTIIESFEGETDV